MPHFPGYRRIWVFAIFLLTAGFASTVHADVRRDFDAALSGVDCPGVANMSGPERLVLLSEWSGRSLIELARRAGFGSKIDNLGEEGRFLSDDENIMLDKMAAAAPGAVSRFIADRKAYGARLCPLLTSTGHDFEKILRDQKRANAPVRPYLRFAQHLSLLHGCYASPADGAFGPASRTAWNRMAQAIAPSRTVSDTGFPLPGDIMEVALTPVASGACDNDAGQASQPLYSFAFKYGYSAGEYVEPLSGVQTVGQFTKAAHFAPTHLRNRIVANALSLWNQYESGAPDDATSVPEDEIFSRFWPLVRQDLSAFVKDVHPPTRESDTSGVYLIAAQRALFGIGVDAFPGPAIELLEKISNGNNQAMYALAGLYQAGIGVAPDPAKAREWLDRYDQSIDNQCNCTTTAFGAFAGYEASRSDALQAAVHVRTLLERDENLQKQNANPEAETGTAPFRNVSISISKMGDFSRIARLIVTYPEVLAVVQEAPARQRFIFGQMILEGRGGDHPARDIGIGLIGSAAKDGLPDAALRLAHIRRYQSPPDMQTAEQLYEIASDAGSAQAAFALAEMYDTDGSGLRVAGAKAFYDKAVSLASDKALQASPLWDLASALQNRIVEGSPFFTTREGEAWLKERVAKDYKLALAIGDAYLCTSCGGIVDTTAAAEWYRRASAVDEDNDKTASYKLARLLLANPDLEASQGEAIAILRRNVPDKPAEENAGWYMSNGSWHARSAMLLLSEELRKSGAPLDDRKSQIATLFAGICPASDNSDCVSLAAEMANGQFEAWMMEPGYRALQKFAEEAGENDTTPAAALADTLASFGDFAGAVAVLRKLPHSQYYDTTRSLHSVKRIVSAHLRRRSSELPAGLLEYMRMLAANDEEEAQTLLDILASPAAETATNAGTVTDLASAQAAFDQQLARGALSRGLAVSARRLAEAQSDGGNKEAALKLEFTSLSTEIKLARVDEMFDGALSGRLVRVCLLSRASERVADLGFDDAAITLAKYAVNELQAARRDISQLPETLRTCFRDLAADHYRWLADLFVRHGRPAEARYVMGLLKDFETYEFVGRDQDYRRRGYDGFELGDLERDFTSALDAIAVPVTGKARWLAEARWKARNGKLSAADQVEMKRVEKELADAGKAFQQQLDQALTAARDLGRLDKAAQIDNLKALQSFLRSEAGGKAAALHFVVLPQRMHAILTTAHVQISHTSETLDGKSFDETNLNRKLDEFRSLLQQPGSDPEPLARDLYDLLVKPFERDLSAAGATTLLISPDRRLRYVPFATLHDQDGYLAQKFSIALLSDAGYEIAGDHRTGLEISALGMTKGTGEFAALPNVGSELAGIVEGAGSTYGFLPGRVVLDKDFTRDTLRDALQFGPPDSGALGVVHIASHFALGATDKTSSLLLGDGTLLSLADIKSDRFTYDFGSVDLLTLSACSTAYGLAMSDGRDIESFSEVSRKGGARAILASLWPVNDLSTSLLMQRFYELRERRNLDKATALATVQREFITGTLGQGDATESIVVETARRGATPVDDDGPAPAVRLDGFKHPFYWAPFVIMGNWQ